MPGIAAERHRGKAGVGTERALKRITSPWEADLHHGRASRVKMNVQALPVAQVGAALTVRDAGHQGESCLAKRTQESPPERGNRAARGLTLMSKGRIFV